MTQAAAFHPSDLFHLLLALAVVALAGRALARGLRRFRQPPVIGEILAGLALGPSVLGHFAPSLAGFLLPERTAPHLGLLSQVGVTLFMFTVGLELNPATLRQRAPMLFSISLGSIAVPFVLGGALALLLFPRFAPPGVSFSIFALFAGISVAVTAFPVLSRILTDRGLSQSPLGALALSCAAIDDLAAWCLLALLVGLVNANLAGIAWTLGLALAYVGAMLGGVRPAIARLLRTRDGPVSPAGLGLAVAAVLLSALVSDAIGIHALFGAFLLGALVPHDSAVARDLDAKIEPLVSVLFLPAFFAFTGMRTQLGLLDGATDWLWCGLIVLTATLGKLGGTGLAARLSGLGWRDSLTMGILMNTRGLMELIVLNVGLELHLLTPKLFTMFVFMSIATTLASTPLFDWISSATPASPVRPSGASAPLA